MGGGECAHVEVELVTRFAADVAVEFESIAFSVEYL